MTESTSATRRGPWPRRVALVFVILLGLLVLAAAWIGIRAVMAKSELDALLPLVQPLREAVADGDIETLNALTTEAQQHASQAASLTGDPVWRAAEVVPWVGANMAAVRIVSSSLDSMTTSALPLLSLADEITQDDGSFDMTVLTHAKEPLDAAAESFARADAELATVDPAPLISPVSKGVTEVTEFAAAAAPAMTSAAKAMAVLPGMMGLDGPRTILVALQNNAELRTGGGITGSFILLGADAGKLSILDQADSGDFRSLDTPIIDLPESITAIEGDDIGRFVQNTSLTSDFTVTAELARAWWATYSSTQPDAVVSIDLAVMAALMGSSGSVTLADGSTVDASTLLQRVLIEPYMTLDQEEQTVFQRMVTTAVLDDILTEGIDPLGWMTSLVAPVEQGRVSMWSSVPEEQTVIADSPLGGPLARLDQTAGSAYAVYLNDFTAGKMDSQLDVQIASGWAVCRPDERADVVVRVTLTNEAPADAASWPWLMTGGGYSGVPAGDIGTDITVASPTGSFFGGVRTQDGELVQSDNLDVLGHPSTRARVVLSPGESSTLEFRYFAAEPGDQKLSVLHTPIMREITPTETDVACG